MKTILCLFLAAAVPICAQTCNSSGTQLTAATCSQADVQACFSAATSTTTQINIPACSTGTAWTSQIGFTAPSGSASLSIIGAGSLTTTGGGDQTVIEDNDTTDTNSLLIVTTASSSSYLRIAGITFESGTGTQKSNGIVNISGDSQSVRIDHDHFNLTTGSGFDGDALRFDGWNYGVVDHAIFDGLNSGQNAITFWEPSYGGGSNAYGDGAWNAATSFGGSNFIFVENSTFNNILTANDCVQGGRYVMRFDTFNATAVQTHPTGSQGRGRGCRALEIYKNSFVQSNSTPIFNAFFMSSGSALVWGNSAPTGYETFISLHSMRRDNSTYTQTATPNGWGYCGTSFDGTGSAWDQNTSTTNGYACLDQPGRGQGDLLEGAFPTACDSTTGCSTYNGSWSSEALQPIYEWLDAWAAVPGYPYSLIDNYNSDVLVQNRDYYISSDAGSGTDCAGFTGATGVGCGPLASAPGTCAQGVGYWATDQGNWNQSGSGGQGELYICNSSNQFVESYEPYTYPHPLDTTGGTTAPTPSTMLLAFREKN